METAQDICGMTKGPCRHKETWWWNEDVAVAVREKKIMYGKWKKENTKEARMGYKKSRQNAKRVISSAKEKKQKECANDLNDSECQNEIFRVAKQMVKERQDNMSCAVSIIIPFICCQCLLLYIMTCSSRPHLCTMCR